MTSAERFGALVGIAMSQAGVFTSEQWYECGLSRAQLRWKVERGEIKRVFYKVYRLSMVPDSPETSISAGCLKAAPVAAAYGATACYAWGLLNFSPPVHVATRRRLDDQEGYRFHRVFLPDEHIVSKGAFGATDVPRTLLDACAHMHPSKAGYLIDKARRLELTDLERLALRCEEEARQGRDGISVMRWAISQRDESDARSKSQLEVEFYRFLDEYGYKQPLKNVPIDIGGPFAWEADCLWKPRKIAEILTYNTHMAMQTFYKDFDKHADLEAGGYELIYITDQMLENKSKLDRRLRAFLGPENLISGSRSA